MKKLTNEELAEWAIKFIGTVDYDIQKECQYNLDEDGEDILVEEMLEMIESFVEEITNDKVYNDNV